MGEVTSPVRAVSIRYMCDQCGEGEMKSGDTVLTCNPPIYPSTCTKCGHRENMRDRYPHMRYEPADTTPPGYIVPEKLK